jgi:hypothetical protein
MVGFARLRPEAAAPLEGPRLSSADPQAISSLLTTVAFTRHRLMRGVAPLNARSLRWARKEVAAYAEGASTANKSGHQLWTSSLGRESGRSLSQLALAFVGEQEQPMSSAFDRGLTLFRRPSEPRKRASPHVSIIIRFCVRRHGIVLIAWVGILVVTSVWPASSKPTTAPT